MSKMGKGNLNLKEKFAKLILFSNTWLYLFDSRGCEHQGGNS